MIYHTGLTIFPENISVVYINYSLSYGYRIIGALLYSSKFYCSIQGTLRQEQGLSYVSCQVGEKTKNYFSNFLFK